MDTDYTILVTLTYIMIIIGGVAGIGLIVAFLENQKKLKAKINQKKKNQMIDF